MLKKIVIGAALAAMVATPALAQAYDPDAGSGNIVSPNGAHVYADTPPYLGQSGEAYAHMAPGGGYYAPGGAYAYSPGHRGRHRARRWYSAPAWPPYDGD